jgi:hypothetical protein
LDVVASLELHPIIIVDIQSLLASLPEVFIIVEGRQTEIRVAVSQDGGFSFVG